MTRPPVIVSAVLAAAVQNDLDARRHREAAGEFRFGIDAAGMPFAPGDEGR